MGTNRFYTQSLPQYTSQFVEDRTPWQSMLALNQQKIGRADAAVAGAAKAEGQFSSLMEGYRSGDIASEVIPEYQQKLSQWQEQYGEHIYSVPAMRALTKIQGQFQADQRVKTVQQDYADRGMWDQMRTQEGYDIRTDPNVVDGELRQFTADDKYTPYATPAYRGDMTTFMNKFYGALEPDETPVQYYETITDPENPQVKNRILQHGYRSYLGAESEKIKTARDEAVRELLQGETKDGKYYKALHGDEFDEDMAREIVIGHENRFYKDRTRVSPMQLREPSASEQSIGNQFTFPASAQKQINPDNVGGSGVDPMDRSVAIGERIRDFKMNMFNELGQEYYNAVNENPDAIIKGEIADNNGNILRQDVTSINEKDIIKSSMLEQPFTTMKVWGEYWDARLENARGEDKENILREKKRYDKIIETSKKSFNVGEPKFTNDIELNKALNSVHESRQADYAYNAGEFLSKETMSPDQAIALRIVQEKHSKETIKKAYTPTLNVFNKELQQEFTAIFAGTNVGDDGVVNSDRGLPEQLAGAIVIDPDDPNKFVTLKEKEKGFKKGTPINVNGKFEDTESQYGAGTFSITIGSTNYIIKGPQEYIQPFEFLNVINTHKLTKNNGEGDFFAFRGINQQNGMPEIVDRWNEHNKGSSSTDVWMNVSLDHTKDHLNPVYVLRVYQKDPHNIDDKYLNEYKEEADIHGDQNTDGYKNFMLYGSDGLPATKTNPPDNKNTYQRAIEVWLGYNIEEGNVGEDDAIEQYQQMFPLNE